MDEVFNFLTHMGDLPALLGLAIVVIYFLLASVIVRLFEPEPIVVAKYEPPKGVSPAVAAWLLERGALPRALAAALVHMGAKGYVEIRQNGDLYSIARLGRDVSLDELSPEEDALVRTLFYGYDCVDIAGPTKHLQDVLDAFNWALADTDYISRRLLLSIPAWAVTAVGIFFAMWRGGFLPHADRGIMSLLTLAFGCFIVAVRNLPGTMPKISTRLPGSSTPRRPWSNADRMNITLLVATAVGMSLLGWLSTAATALLVTAYLGVNANFYHTLEGPTAAGLRVIGQLKEYREYLAKVDADEISRMNACGMPPAEMTEKQSYAIAFHLDMGWGQQFVDAVSNVVERSEVFD